MSQPKNNDKNNIFGIVKNIFFRYSAWRVYVTVDAKKS